MSGANPLQLAVSAAGREAARRIERAQVQTSASADETRATIDEPGARDRGAGVRRPPHAARPLHPGSGRPRAPRRRAAVAARRLSARPRRRRSRWDRGGARGLGDPRRMGQPVRRAARSRHRRRTAGHQRRSLRRATAGGRARTGDRRRRRCVRGRRARAARGDRARRERRPDCGSPPVAGFATASCAAPGIRRRRRSSAIRRARRPGTPGSLSCTTEPLPPESSSTPESSSWPDSPAATPIWNANSRSCRPMRRSATPIARWPRPTRSSPHLPSGSTAPAPTSSGRTAPSRRPVARCTPTPPISACRPVSMSWRRFKLRSASSVRRSPRCGQRSCGASAPRMYARAATNDVRAAAAERAETAGRLTEAEHQLEAAAERRDTLQATAGAAIAELERQLGETAHALTTNEAVQRRHRGTGRGGPARRGSRRGPGRRAPPAARRRD